MGEETGAVPAGRSFRFGSGGGATAGEKTLATAQMACKTDVSGKPGEVGGRDKAAMKEGRWRIRLAWGSEAKKTSTLTREMKGELGAGQGYGWLRTGVEAVLGSGALRARKARKGA